MEKISFQPVYSEGTTILSGRRGVVQTLAQCAAHRVKTPDAGRLNCGISTTGTVSGAREQI